MNLAEITRNLELREDGIWFSAHSHVVAYPQIGNESCFEIEDQSYWFQHRNKCVISAMQQLPPSGALLDIGGGNGFVAAGIQEAGLEVILLEPGLHGARNAKKRGVQSVICSTLQDANFLDQSIPAAGLFDVIEHIEDDVEFLHSIANLLKKGGRLYLTTPAYKVLWSVEDDYAQHFRRYTITQLKQNLQETGFQIEFATYIFLLLPLPIFFFRTIPGKLFGSRASGENVYKQEHTIPAGWSGGFLRGCLNMELAAIENRRSLPFGGSCLVVACKR